MKYIIEKDDAKVLHGATICIVHTNNYSFAILKLIKIHYPKITINMVFGEIICLYAAADQVIENS